MAIASACDVVVLGGGPAGTATAIALRGRGLTVVVLETSHYDRASIGETLPPGARAILARLGVWDRFVDAGHASSPGIVSIWGEETPFENPFILSPYGDGWHLDRQRFDAMLADSAAEAGARICCGARMSSCVPEFRDGAAIGWHAVFSHHGLSCKLRTRFVIDATGRAAAFARRQRAHRIAIDRLVSLVMVLPLQVAAGDHDGRTVVEAAADGWWYSAMLPGARVIAGYMTDADLLPRRRGSRRDFWDARLDGTTRTKEHLRSLGVRAPGSTEPSLVAANTSRLDAFSGRGWLAAGDAAFALDPLSSAGLLHALTSGIDAADAAQKSFAGDDTALRAYDERRHRTFARQAQLRTLHYGREQRWPRSVFWNRRQDMAGAEPSVRIPVADRSRS
jgi:flavin-dependent dehydrogenase